MRMLPQDPLRVAITAAVLLAGLQSACSRKEPVDVAEARPVMEELLEAQRDRRGALGTFWRDRQPTVDRGAAVKALGVDIGKAPNFEFVIEPSEGGIDPVLRVTARGKGDAANVSIVCAQKAKADTPDCTETAGR